MGWTYEKAGVNLAKHWEMHSIAREIIHGIANELGIRLIEGGFTRSINLGNYEITLHTDGVGTKSMIAWSTGRLEVVGWDCVVGNVNDIACDGFTPVALTDYIAISSNDVGAIHKVLVGIRDAATKAGAVLLGGEVAIMPDLVNGIDVSCSVLGIRRMRVAGDVRVGDVVIGVESNGLHMNGYTLTRKVLLGRYGLEDEVCGDRLINWLLRPTTYYGDLLIKLYDNKLVKAAIHITGGGFTKVRRVIGDLGVRLEVPEPPCIFEVIREVGNVEWSEMYRVFNMGIGLMLIVGGEYVDDTARIIKELGLNYWVLGKVVEGGGINILMPNGFNVRL
ncbi:MAG: phosphoribosylformylglycinamidine cyclo-ligase [Vulcanisaeta sp.]|uniref:phosphoribosylformylglycinamidine cyclo-ligase n=1 Tax=Vulcanisaeta sp. TaxID=2020871 RepID=UPI003D10852B